MRSAGFFRLPRLLGAVSAAEAARLAGVLAQIASCRGRAARLRGEIGASLGEPGPGAGPLVAAELAAAAMAKKARNQERRLAERRAEAAVIAPRRAPDQPDSSSSEPAGTSSGSPGIA